MADLTTTPPPMAANPAPPPPAGNPALDPALEERRRKWREKKQRTRDRKAGILPPFDPATAASRPAVASVGAVPPPAGGPAPGAVGLPWDSNVLKPLFASLVPALEKADVESLRARAAKLDAALAQMVATDAPWNPAAKVTLIETGPEVTARMLNRVGISGEHAPEVAFLVAAGSIIAGRMLLSGKLDEMLAQKKAATPVPAPAAP